MKISQTHQSIIFPCCCVSSLYFIVFVCVFFFCSHWSLVDVPLIFFCPADHVPDWQPRILLGMVEARSVYVIKITTYFSAAHHLFLHLPLGGWFLAFSTYYYCTVQILPPNRTWYVRTVPAGSLFRFFETLGKQILRRTTYLTDLVFTKHHPLEERISCKKTFDTAVHCLACSLCVQLKY